MVPPVAMLVYDPKALQKAAFYPFAEFSPEWIAMQLASEQNIPIEFNDLSIGYYWPEDQADLASPTTLPHPLSLIAEAAGYPDSESWWDQVIENLPEKEDHFEALWHLMHEARKQAGPSDLHNQRREAMMRKSIRKALKEGYERIAVVCGAFHAPALVDLPPAKQDNALLKGMKRRKMQATWIPWTYQRLAYQSGYGAGVRSPAWYELIYHYPQDKRAERWLARLAALFRQEGLQAAPSQLIDAVRLAQNLALLRGKWQPSLDELLETVPAVFELGSEDRLQWVANKLIVGDKMGQTPPAVPVFPLQKDIQRLQISLRIKPISEKKEIHLDLRKEFDHDKSVFLHRLNILQIEWGQALEVKGNDGTFRESWRLQWQAEMEIQVIEAASWGNTVIQAAEAKVQHALTGRLTVGQLSQWLEKVFLAELEDAFLILIDQLATQSSLSSQIEPLLQTLPPLIKMLRYGNVRNNQTYDIQQLLKGLLPRIWIGLPDACRNLDEELAEQRFAEILQAHQAMALLAGLEMADLHPLWLEWQQQLSQLAHQSQIHPAIQGLLVRILFDNQLWDEEAVSRQMAQMLSPGTEHQVAARWIEGLLHGSGLLLIHYPPLFRLLDQWVSGMDEAAFQTHLPLLRRTFSRFSLAERRQMGTLAKGDSLIPDNDVASLLNPERTAKVWPVFELLLGLTKN